MIRAGVDFSKKLRAWDGFGVNYVETSQTANYEEFPQDYGGFSTLSPAKRNEILDLVFGEDGLKPGLIKMFFDPFHQTEDHRNPADLTSIDPRNYDHETTSQWTRFFAKEGLKRTKSRNGDLSIVTTLYSPPAWMTKQKFLRGRDFDRAYDVECAKYMVSWVKFLIEEERLPVRYISLHNEGEDFVRWPADGSAANFLPGHDYNMHWPPELVAHMVKLVRRVLDAHGLTGVGVTPGETTNWYRFDQWGYADAIADDSEAMASLGLITSHGFICFDRNRWFGDTRSVGNDLLRAKKPELHSWVTSISWSKMDVHFLNEFRHNIYSVKVNGIIPWACIQYPQQWAKGDPNPGTAFRVDGQGDYAIAPGYYYYKQLCRAGQPGMAVARVYSNDTQIGMLGFAQNTSQHKDSIVILNTSDDDKITTIEIKGAGTDRFTAYRTSPSEKYVSLGEVSLADGQIRMTIPAQSVTTLFGC